MEKKIFFMGNEEFEYIVEEKDGVYYGKTSFDPRLNTQASSLNEVYDILMNRIQQYTKAS